MRIAVAALVFLASPLTAPSQEPWLLLRELEATGNASTSRDDLVLALACDPAVQDLLRAGIDDETCRRLGVQVQEKYISAGFAEAVVQGSLRDGRIGLAIREGQRFRCGAVRCRGNQSIGTARLTALLAEESKSWSGWRDGGFPPSGEVASQRAVEIVGEAYRGAGRFGVRATATFRAVDDRLELDLEVQDEGREVRLRSIELRGEEAGEREAAQARVRWERDALLTTDLLASLKKQVEDIGRYDTVVVELPDAPAALLDPLPIRVRVWPKAPSLASIDERAVVQLRTALANVVAHVESGKMVRFAFDLPSGVWTWTLGRDGCRLLIDAVRLFDRPPTKLHFLFAPERVILGLGDRFGCCQFEEPAGFQFIIQTSFDDRGECEFRWGAGATMRSAKPPLLVQVHPATAVYMLHGENPVARRDGDDVVLVLAGKEALRIGPDGALRSHSIRIESDNGPVAFELVDVSFANEQRAVLPEEPLQPLAAVLPGWLFAVPPSAADARVDQRSAALLRGLAAVLANHDKEIGRTRQQKRFQLAWSAPTIAHLLRGAAAGLAASREWQGWTVDLLGAASNLALGNVKAANARFAAFGDDERHGPLAMYAAGGLAGFLGRDRARSSFVAAADERWAFDAFYRDADDLLASFPSLAFVPAAVGAHWRQQPELAELFAGLADDADRDVAAWRLGLRTLWDGGLGRQLHEALFDDK